MASAKAAKMDAASPGLPSGPSAPPHRRPRHSSNPPTVLTAVLLDDGSLFPCRVYVRAGGMVDVAVRELGARLVRVEQKEAKQPEDVP